MNFFFYQNESELPQQIINGNCYFVSSTSSSKGFDIYIDQNGERSIFVDDLTVGITYKDFMNAIKDLIFSTINIESPTNITINPTAFVLNTNEQDNNSFPIRTLGDYTGYIIYGNQGKSAPATIEVTATGQTLTLSPKASQLIIDSNTSSVFTLQSPSGKQVQITEKNYVLWENGTWTISADSQSQKFSVNLGQNITVTMNQQIPDQDDDYYIGFITDSHEANVNLDSLNSHNPNIIIHGGDYVNYGSLDNVTTNVNHFGKHIATIGNHDYTKTSSYNTFWSAAELANCFSNTYMGSSTNGYYYYDITSAKIRIIVLNTQDRSANNSMDDPQHNHNISAAQLSFLESALVGRGADWRAIIISHCPLTPMNDRPGWYGGTVGTNITNICSSTLKGYSVSEAKDKMSVLLCLSGHCHALGYKYYQNICHLTGYAYNASVNTYGGETGDDGSSGENKSHWYLIKISSDNSVTVYDYVDNSIFKTIKIDGTESDGGSVNPDSDTIFSCIAFENGKLQYLDSNRSDWNQSNASNPINALYDDCDKIQLKIICSKDVNNEPKIFNRGLLSTKEQRIELTPPDENNPTYAIYFDDSGKYLGYSKASEQNMTTQASNRFNDFFGVPEQKISDALGS